MKPLKWKDAKTLLRLVAESLLILAIAGLIAAIWLPGIVGPSPEKKARNELTKTADERK